MTTHQKALRDVSNRRPIRTLAPQARALSGQTALVREHTSRYRAEKFNMCFGPPRHAAVCDVASSAVPARPIDFDGRSRRLTVSNECLDTQSSPKARSERMRRTLRLPRVAVPPGNTLGGPTCRTPRPD